MCDTIAKQMHSYSKCAHTYTHLEVNSVNISVNILRQIIMAYYKKQTSMSLSLQLPSLNAVCVRVWVISAEIQLESQVLKIRT